MANVNGTLLLNRTGDIAITWEANDDVRVLSYLQKKMNEGYVFFVVDKKFFRLVNRKKRVTDVNKLGKERTIYLDDEDAEALVKDQVVTLTQLESGSNLETVRRAKTAKEAAANTTVGVKPLAGG